MRFARDRCISNSNWAVLTRPSAREVSSGCISVCALSCLALLSASWVRLKWYSSPSSVDLIEKTFHWKTLFGGQYHFNNKYFMNSTCIFSYWSISIKKKLHLQKGGYWRRSSTCPRVCSSGGVRTNGNNLLNYTDVLANGHITKPSKFL